jgi:hypothetical protein
VEFGVKSEIRTAIQEYGADAVFTAAGACENLEPLRAMDLDVYDISDADYIGTVVYNSMTPEEKESLYQEALADDPLGP